MPEITKKPDAKTVTLSFEAKDAALFAKIVKDAEEDDRSPSKLLMIFLRKHYKPTDDLVKQ